MSTTLLLTHLQNSTPNVPLETITAALAHHLAVDLPTPTPLTAAAVSSPYFLTPTNEKLQAIVTAFRHAAHLKHQALVKKTEEGWSLSRTIFSRGVEGGIKEWVRGVIRGLQGGRAVLRLACSTGLLLGVKSLPHVGIADGNVEDEVVIALAEVMDDYNSDPGTWEREFQPKTDGMEILLSFTSILASQSLPSIPKVKLRALPLTVLGNHLISTISSAFHDGMIFRTTSNSSFDQRIRTMTQSPTMLYLAGISKLSALTLELLIESSADGLRMASKMMDMYQTMAARVEQDWKVSEFASVQTEDELCESVDIFTEFTEVLNYYVIASDKRQMYKSVWLLLKTLLFSTIMVGDGILGAVIYARPVFSHAGNVTPHVLAKSILRTLSHLSFVVSQFGGVTATAVSDDPGFVELRKVFYLALDILSAQEQSNRSQLASPVLNPIENFVKEIVMDLGVDSSVPREISARYGMLHQAKTAYTLACIEQLVPSMGNSCLKDYVWPLCVPYLSDPSHRETYESAHSVVLSIFASDAQQHQSSHTPESRSPGDSDRSTLALESNGFIRRMVPFYAQCLIENSQDGRLSTAQLRLAYTALVKSASASDSSSESHRLGWFCIALILDVIRAISSKVQQNGLNDAADRLHRLHLTLISTVSSLPMHLMIRALEEIRIFITVRQQSDSGVGGIEDHVEEERERKELVEALFTEILTKVGDQEKEAAINWWYANRYSFIPASESPAMDMFWDLTSRL
ncbi:hypothetical protein H0H92_004427 [Tricholoma furcatifolium]|nr:hypothetical protein H0H92_004427 [Tricholoma furcatifolium]